MAHESTNTPAAPAPPAYNEATHSDAEPLLSDQKIKSQDTVNESHSQSSDNGPSNGRRVSHPAMPTPPNYQLSTQAAVPAALLSPEEMVCLQEGYHIPGQSFGLLGVLAAVLWFPLGVGVCLLDRKVKCKRCGKIINDSCTHSVCD